MIPTNGMTMSMTLIRLLRLRDGSLSSMNKLRLITKRNMA